MQTKLIKIDADDPNKEDMREAAEIIRSGGLVAFPTETVYGLGANALDPEASKRIYAAKGRPSDNPLIVHICRFEELLSIAKEVPPQAKKLADAFWPGPLTMIVWKNEKVPYPHRAVQRAYPAPGHGQSKRPAPAACGARYFPLPLPSVRSWP